MYPSSVDKLFGVFVKNFKEEIESQGVCISSSALMMGKTKILYIKFVKYFKHYFNIIKLFFKKDYDIIYLHFLSHHIPILLMILFFKNKPIVINLHGNDLRYIENYFILKYAAYYIIKKSDMLVVPSSFFKIKLLNMFLKVDEKKVYVYPSGGIDTSVFFPQDKMKIGVFHIGFVSRIIADKGWETLLNSLKILQTKNIDFKVTIAGKGQDEQSLINRIKDLGLKNVEYIGFIEQTKLINFYNEFDVYVFPTYKDSLGLTGLESMACATPVIASNIEGPSTYIRNGENGFLFEVGDSNDLAQKIIEFKSFKKDEKLKMINNAVQTASLYDRSYVTMKLLNNLSKLF